MTTTNKGHLFQPKYSKKLQDFICDKIEEGMTLAEVCREYGPPKHSTCPNEKTCYRWKKKYPEFSKALRDAYQILIFKMMDEMNDLSKDAMQLSDELKDATGIGEAKFESMRLKGRLDAIKTRIKALEFMLTRIAPKLVDDLRERSIDTKLSQLPAITIVNYSTKPTANLIEYENGESESK